MPRRLRTYLGAPRLRAGLLASRSARVPHLWTPRLRRPLLAIVVVLIAALWTLRWREAARLPDPPGDGPRAAELCTRLDPNTADAAALSALPGLGEARARAIVDYRTAYLARHAARPPFHATRDLLPIKGIGVATVNNLEPYLTFPGR